MQTAIIATIEAAAKHTSGLGIQAKYTTRMECTTTKTIER